MTAAPGPPALPHPMAARGSAALAAAAGKDALELPEVRHTAERRDLSFAQSAAPVQRLQQSCRQERIGDRQSTRRFRSRTGGCRGESREHDWDARSCRPAPSYWPPASTNYGVDKLVLG